MAQINVPWSEKYRPKSVSEYIFHDADQKKRFLGMIKSREIPNLLLSGIRGTGKSTLSGVLLKELGIDQLDILRINASDENGVDTMRDKIKAFAQTYAMGDIKVVQLEECLDENTAIVILRDGLIQSIKIAELKSTDLLKTFNIESEIIEWLPFDLLDKGNRDDCLEIELENGETIICTPEHKWYVSDVDSISIVRADQLENFGHILSPDYK